MSKKILLSIILVCSLIATGFVINNSDMYFRISKSIDIFGRVYKEVAVNYVDQINPEEFMLAGIKGMLSSLDPYSGYIPEKHQGDIDLITRGKYGGIGATVGLRNDDIIIVDLLEGYSAQRQGMQIGDVILSVDSIGLSRDNYDDLGAFLKGDPGTVVSLKVKREGEDETLTFNLVREEVEVHNLSFYGFVPEESNNAYLRLSAFSISAGEEIKNALLEMKKQKPVESIILDLRGNPGGLLNAAIDVSDKFLKDGQLIVSVMARDSTLKKEYFAKEEPIAGNTKLIVMVDGGSASASEIVAGAIQDHDRGVILGTHSFGKGLVQTVIPLSFNASLKLTTARYFTPSGRCIQRINYSERNKVFDKVNVNESKVYKTDKNRSVYAAGGIKPDTVISFDTGSQIYEQLLAHGMFFQFATKYFNNHKGIKRDTLADGLYNAFIDYLREQDYEFEFRSEKLLSQLAKLAEKNEYNAEFQKEIHSLAESFNDIKEAELDKYKNEIVNEIRLELKARTDGRLGRITESLKYDKQFESALEVLNDDCTYQHFLGECE